MLLSTAYSTITEKDVKHVLAFKIWPDGHLRGNGTAQCVTHER
jgi:hypothetical protein